MTYDNRFRNRQPEPAAGSCRRACGIHFVKAVEYVRQVFRRDAAAGVRHRQHRTSIRYSCAQRDSAPLRCVTDGVRYQVLDDLLDAIGVANDLTCTAFNL